MKDERRLRLGKVSWAKLETFVILGCLSLRPFFPCSRIKGSLLLNDMSDQLVLPVSGTSTPALAPRHFTKDPFWEGGNDKMLESTQRHLRQRHQ